MINKQSPKNLSAFLYTQFFVAFNDNMHYIAVAVYLAGLSKESASAWQAFVSAAFMAPFILFSPLAGSLADRFNKRSVLIISKWFEVVPMSVSLFASLALEPPLQYWGLVAGVFLMEVQSAFFSPAKYGILPEITEEQNLIKINGILEMLTIIAIILGQATGGILLGNTGLRITIAVCLLTAVVGSILSFRIPFGISGSKTSKIEIIPFINIHKTLGKMSADRRIIVLLFSLSLFWMVAAMFRMNLPVFGSHTLYLDETLTGIMISVMSLGIGAGSLIATSIRSHHMGLGVIFPAITGMSLSAILLYAVGYTYSTSTLILGVTGFFGGLYLVPQNAIFQSRSPKESRGSYIATLNLVSFSLMFVSSLIFWALTSLLGLDSSGVFLMIGLFLMVAGILLCLALPEIVTWAIVFTVTRLFYRIKSYGGKNIPAQGGVLLAPNHITLVDSFFLFSTCSRPLKFIIDKTWYDHPILHPLFKAINLIPMSQGMGSKGAINAAIEGLKNGSVIVVFPEGELSRIGNIQRFRSGIEHISKEANVPILPVHIDRLWGSMFSFRGGKFIKKLPQRFPYPVTVTYGKLLPPGSDSFKVRQEVIELSSFAFRSRLQDFKSLGNEFIKSAKQRLFRTAMTDSTGKKISFFTLLVNSILLSKLLKSRCKKEEMIGMILPPSIAGAICNISVQLAGKVPVNLNWTTSEQALKSSISKCNLKTILTSKAVIKRLPFELRTANLELKIEFVDDLVKQIDVLSYASWSFAALLLPTGMLSKLLKSANSLDDPATIIFSSGTTGDPKGVILTNANIISNVLGISEVFTINKDDRILGGLPFFHSFGFTATIWLPLIKGLSVSYHHNPLDAKGVSKAVQKSGSTILAATPTFLQLYMKKCETADFKTLRHVIVGAEKLNPQLAKEFEGKFGIVPREGYGCTELSPVVSINTPDVIDKGIKQIGTRLGTIGRPLPGVAVKVVDPSTFEELGPNTDGMLLVRGANVMRGYLGEPGLTAEVLKEGWYITGDIARVDEDGFITITDRISRFSKIGGEMVPHIKIEEAIQEICKDTEKSVVVTGVPDQQKGERLVVLHTKDFNPSEVIEELRRRGLPPLWIPKPESFRKISEIPLLGTGKVDLQVARQLTKQLLISGR